MADISLHVDGEVKFQSITETNGKCLMINVSFDLPFEGGAIPISRDTVYFHGSIESIREFARKMLQALPPEAEEREPECTCEQTDVDRFDASGCELHNPASPWNRRQAETR